MKIRFLSAVFVLSCLRAADVSPLLERAEMAY
jgi:hypothetical protein